MNNTNRAHRIICYLLSVALIFGIVSIYSINTKAVSSKVINLSDGTESVSGSNWSYDKNNHTLTLNGFINDDSTKEDGVYYGGDTDLTINLIGYNKLTTACSGIFTNSAGIIISGTGTLVINTKIFGLYAVKDVVIDNATLDITTTDNYYYGDVSNSGAIHAKNITIKSNAKITAKGIDRAFYLQDGIVNSELTAIAYTNYDGTGTSKILDGSSSGWMQYKKIVMPAPQAKTTSAPIIITNIVSDGTMKNLVTPGSGTGGTMYYAVNSSKTTAPTVGWSSSIPQAKNPGTYYVWYKIVGDSNHADSTPECVEVTIYATDSNSETNATTSQKSYTEIQVEAQIDKKQKTTKFTKISAAKKSITLNWKKITDKGINGYEIQYSTDKNFKKDVTKTVTIKKVKTTKTTIKKLKSKTKYYVRIRTYSMKNGQKVYSNWSKKKSVKVN
ncbi:fibronectin type III domain-containing protein [Butyrivibrio sp. AE3006]|uniref:fibronectin type III domain-containing protein n=1 Tax=Butyrivibrio sp. AE3006 TaxID=1280673 RepID=UPI000479727D|nr:fibronectin type III domain-containing protein [Butyrivibrio sp. AE3006]